MGSRIRGFFSRKNQAAEFAAELERHAELLTAENIRRGMTPAEARLAALRRLGNATQLAEANRELRGLPFLETLLQDLRYGARMLRRSPGFSFVAILIFAVGIGGSSALFSVVKQTVVSGIPFRSAENIGVVWRERIGAARTQGLMAPAEYLAYSQSKRAIGSLSAMEAMTAVDAASENAAPIAIARVTPEVFGTLGIAPSLGRGFTEADSQGGAAQVALVSEPYCESHFGKSEAAIGKTLTLQISSMNRDVSATSGVFSIVGVLPRGLPFNGLAPLSADIWLPMPAAGMAANRTTFDLFVLGRLAAGAQWGNAQAELDATAAELRRASPQTNANWGARAIPIRTQVYGELEGSLEILGAAIGLVLLIACANVAHLQFARATARKKEFAVRSALGASRARQVRQIVTEGMLLALLGGILGIALGEWGLRAIATRANFLGIPARQLHMEALPILASLALALAAGIASSLQPALRATRERCGGFGADGIAARMSRYARLRGRGALIASELALAAALLCCAGLLMKSFYKLENVPLGFARGNTLTMRLSLPRAAYPTEERREQFYREVIAKVEALPGVAATGAINLPPLIGRDAGIPYTPEGADAGTMRGVLPAAFRAVSPGYFRAMGIALIAGREFDDNDLLHTRVIVNQAFARMWWPQGDAVGKRVKLTPVDVASPTVPIVGVVSDVRQVGLATPDRPAIYLALMEEPAMTLVVRTAAQPESLAEPVRDAVRTVDRMEAGSAVSPMTEIVAASIAQPRFRTALLAIFAVLGLFLAAMGVYGVTAFYVAGRRKEIGIRMAIGAESRQIVALILREGMLPAAVGALVGVGASMALARWMSSFLFGTSALDASVLTLAPAVLLVLTGLACLGPSLRAAHGDPLIALRHD